MFVVYARAFGGPRRPLAHFAALTAAQSYADGMNAVMPSDELTIVEQPDAGRKNFVDRPAEPTADEGTAIDASVPVEAAPKGVKK